MRIMVFTEGTILTHSIWSGIPREEVVRRIREGERPGSTGTIPIGGAARKIRAWNNAGAEIVYLTSRRSLEEVGQVKQALRHYDFPSGELFSRMESEDYADVAERARPDVIIEDDCESIGGESEMTYPGIQPETKARIVSIVVKEFGGIDHLSDRLSDLVPF